MVPGIDLEFERNEILHIISIKSGSNWGNSAQKKQMIENFRRARQVYHQGASKSEIRAIEGCCYGITGKKFDKGTHQKMCGREFWELISGRDFTYQSVFQLIGEISDTLHETYEREYAVTIERLSKELSQDYALENGEINWDKILNLNAVNPIPLFLYPVTDQS